MCVFTQPSGLMEESPPVERSVRITDKVDELHRNPQKSALDQ